ARRQAARAHDVRAPEPVRVLHADPRRAIAAHGVADKATALAGGDRPVVRVDVRHDVARHVVLEITCRHRAGVHRAVVQRLRVWQHENHLVRALGKRSLDGLRHVDFLSPLLGANRIAVQRVDDRVTARAVLVVARGQEDDHVAIDGVSLQVAFEGRSVNLDAFDDGRTGARHRIGHVGLPLRDDREGASRYSKRGRQNAHAPFYYRVRHIAFPHALFAYLAAISMTATVYGFRSMV